MIKVRIIKKLLQYSSLVIMPIFLFFLILELALRTGFFDGKDNPAPIWIPEHLKEANRQINQRNFALANQNSFGFTDKERSKNKPYQTARIAVLGDSFIWGRGVTPEVIWSHKLEKKINAYYKSIEVLSWGISGWSTSDELTFLKNHGKDYGIDLLIVGFTTNDPDIGRYSQKYLNFGSSVWFSPIKKIFPTAFQFIRAYINNIYERYFTENLGYFNWEKKLYSDENLKEYSKILSDFSQYCRQNHIELLFVLTPNNYQQSFREKFDKVIPLLKESNITFLDLYPTVYDNLHHLPNRALWANPADAHPGDLVTEIYKDEVYNFLSRSGKLDYLNNHRTNK